LRRPREDHRPADEYSVPISELEIPKVFYSISDKTREFIKRLMDNRARGLSIEGDSNLRVNITPNDFFSLPEDASDDNLLRFCKNMLDVEEIDEKVIEKLSRCLVPAKDFLQNYLHISSFPKELRDLQEIKSREELLKILRKTRALKSHSKGFSPLYSHF